MKILELFGGIGAPRKALEKSNGERVQAAIDKNPVLTAAQHEARLKIDRAIKNLSIGKR